MKSTQCGDLIVHPTGKPPEEREATNHSGSKSRDAGNDKIVEDKNQGLRDMMQLPSVTAVSPSTKHCANTLSGPPLLRIFSPPQGQTYVDNLRPRRPENSYMNKNDSRQQTSRLGNMSFFYTFFQTLFFDESQLFSKILKKRPNDC